MEIPELKSATKKLALGDPTAFMRTLSSTEYTVLRILSSAKHALTVKAVQRAVIEDLLRDVGSSRLAGGLEHVYPKTMLMKALEEAKGKQLSIPDIPYRRVFSMPTNDVIALARYLELNPPSDKTIQRTLESLLAQGLVGRRLMAEGARAHALYFLTPEIASLKFEEKKGLRKRG